MERLSSTATAQALAPMPAAPKPQAKGAEEAKALSAGDKFVLGAKAGAKHNTKVSLATVAVAVPVVTLLSAGIGAGLGKAIVDNPVAGAKVGAALGLTAGIIGAPIAIGVSALEGALAGGAMRSLTDDPKTMVIGGAVAGVAAGTYSAVRKGNATPTQIGLSAVVGGAMGAAFGASIAKTGND